MSPLEQCADLGPPWKVGNEFLPFHPSASQVPPEHRDGWNYCFVTAQAEVARLRAALGRLIDACDAANAAAIQQLGGVVIDFREVSAALRSFDGSVSFCGGWPNILTTAQNGQPKLTWDLAAEPKPCA